MAKHINLQKNYSLNQSGYQLKLPLNIETMIPENDSVRLLSQFVEAMDLTDLYSTYERINSVSPRTLLKIVLYSYMNEDDSSRSMELNCKRDINFMSLDRRRIHGRTYDKRACDGGTAGCHLPYTDHRRLYPAFRQEKPVLFAGLSGIARAHGFISSMSRKGNCRDNAPMESFWGKLKQE